MNNTFILLILSPYIFSKPCKYWLSSIHTRLFEIIFYRQGDATWYCWYITLSPPRTSPFFIFSSLSFYSALSVSTNRSNLSWSAHGFRSTTNILHWNYRSKGKNSVQMQKNSYKTPFLKSYSFAIHDIKLLFNIWISNGLAVCC